MGRDFQTTRWSVILEAVGSSPGATDALEQLCQIYWYPLYAFVRRQGHDAEQARDLTQSYFVKLLETGYLKQADPAAGKFRSFLLVSIKHFLSNERSRALAQKRRADNPDHRITLDGAEDRFLADSSEGSSPEILFDRRWAMTLRDRALQQLADEYATEGKAKTHAELNGFITGDDAERPYASVAAELGIREGAVKVAVLRMRRRLGRLLRDEVSCTVDRPEQVDEELRYLLQMLGA